MLITRKSHAAYKCTLRHHPSIPETETFFTSAGNMSTLRTSGAIQAQKAIRTTNCSGSYARKWRLLFYKNRQLWLWMVSIGLIIGIFFLAQTVQLIGYSGTE